jgi:hypothetical protein
MKNHMKKLFNAKNVDAKKKRIFRKTNDCKYSAK